jgi:hypothetical protein
VNQHPPVDREGCTGGCFCSFLLWPVARSPETHLPQKVGKKNFWLDHQLLFITCYIAHFKSWTDLCQQQTSTLPPKIVKKFHKNF